mmetsp:Transcript_2446/g.3759  ORF Transcript_2446/g.3759 Transcript_2446/m.3759 type:complete len:149 (-) Transcript_2446:332-778(-)
MSVRISSDPRNMINPENPAPNAARNVPSPRASIPLPAIVETKSGIVHMNDMKLVTLNICPTPMSGKMIVLSPMARNPSGKIMNMLRGTKHFIIINQSRCCLCRATKIMAAWYPIRRTHIRKPSPIPVFSGRPSGEVLTVNRTIIPNAR